MTEKIFKTAVENYRQLKALSSELFILLESEFTPEQVEDIFARREQMMKQVAMGDEELAKLSEEQMKNWSGKDELVSLLKQVVELDARCEEIMTKGKGELFEEIKKLNKGGNAMKGYGNINSKKGGDGRFLSIRE